MVKLSVIILTYNSSKYIDALLQSLIKKYPKDISEKRLEIIVADNESLDDTIKLASKYKDKIKIISNGGNYGYAKGNNLAFKKANGEFTLFLNPDARLTEGDFFKILEIFQNEKVGVVGGKMVSFSGKRELSCGKFYKPFNTFILSLGLEEKLGLRFSPKKEMKVDFVSGGFLFIRSDIFRKLNGFDENYFMYIEDSDLCYQVKKKGYDIVFSNKATIQHVGQGSSNRTFAIVNIYKGLLYFNRKNSGKISYTLVRTMLKLKAIFLVLIGKMRNNKYLVETYSEALKAIK